MSDPLISNPERPESASSSNEFNQSFKDVLAQFEQNHKRASAGADQGREGTVIAMNGEAVVLDIGYKTEGLLPLGECQGAVAVKVGDKVQVRIKGRDPEGYYELTRGKIQRVTDWDSLKKAFDEKAIIVGTVTGLVKGGYNVDVGVRAFMPASRSGVREASEMGKLVEQEIRCRIIKLDVDDEDVVVDRRAVAEDEERAAKDQRYGQIKQGDTLSGTVRSLTDYGAFVDIGDADALLHISDISWSRINKAADVLSAGQQIDVCVLKIEPEKRRISVGMKQLTPHPWDAVSGKYSVGERVRGVVTRVTDFGAFVELEPGIEGLIHISEMSWGKKIRKASDAVKPGEAVEVVILGISGEERRMSLGLKQALGDPWVEVGQKFPVGSIIEGPVTSLTKFGAFVQLSDGVEGMIHVSDLSAEKRIHHPQDMLKVGQAVKAQVLELDIDKRRLKLGIKQMVPTGIEEYIAEHKTGDTVTGRVIETSPVSARVELGEGIHAACLIKTNQQPKPEEKKADSKKVDLSSLGSMLQARWKAGGPTATTRVDEVLAGQVRSFKITKLDAAGNKIEVELA
jgi:small subunit ribosomal protein S1